MHELIADQQIQVLIPPDSGGRTTLAPAGLAGAAQRGRSALASPTSRRSAEVGVRASTEARAGPQAERP